MRVPGAFRTLMLIPALLVLVTASCKRYESVLPPKLEWNEHPVDSYGATLTISGMPEPYSMEGIGVFSIQNRDCLPIDKRRSLGGSRHHYFEQKQIQAVKVDANTYRLKFHKDSIKSSNYYGLGECKWSGSVNFRVHTRDVAYTVRTESDDDSSQEVEQVCFIRHVGPYGSCVDAEYARITDDSNYFRAKTRFFKE
jgi:hypothetical protein